MIFKVTLAVEDVWDLPSVCYAALLVLCPCCCQGDVSLAYIFYVVSRLGMLFHCYGDYQKLV